MALPPSCMQPSVDAHIHPFVFVFVHPGLFHSDPFGVCFSFIFKSTAKVQQNTIQKTAKYSKNIYKTNKNNLQRFMHFLGLKTLWKKMQWTTEQRDRVGGSKTVCKKMLLGCLEPSLIYIFIYAKITRGKYRLYPWRLVNKKTGYCVFVYTLQTLHACSLSFGEDSTKILDPM